MPKAVIFDVDGTLVDTVDMHAKAWQEAFRDYGQDIPFEPSARRSARGATSCCRFCCRRQTRGAGASELEKHGRALKERSFPACGRFPACAELFERVQADGKRVALASSAKGDELETYKKIADIGDLIEAGNLVGRRREVQAASRYLRGRPGAAGRSRPSGWSSSATLPTTPRPRGRPACAPSESSAAASRKPISAPRAASRSIVTRPTCSPGTTGRRCTGRRASNPQEAGKSWRTFHPPSRPGLQRTSPTWSCPASRR